MKKAEALRVLTRNRKKLREMGVRQLALFGSVVRDEATEASDIDVLVDLDETAGYFQFLDIQDFLQQILAVPKVDLVLRRSLFEDLKEGILREAIDVLQPDVEVPGPAHFGGNLRRARLRSRSVA